MVVVDVAHVFRVFRGPKGLMNVMDRHQPGHGLAYNTVQMWSQRQKIPSKWVAAVSYCCYQTGHDWREFLIDNDEMLGSPSPRKRRDVRVLGVDPGAGGALALLDTELVALVVCDMPIATVRVGGAYRKQISETWLADTLRLYEPDCAYIERVHAMPKQGVTSSFTFGMSYGMVRGILAAMRVPTILVTPQEWKKSFRLGASKHEARLIASRLLPANAKDFTRVRDDGRAEAALLALFGANQTAK